MQPFSFVITTIAVLSLGVVASPVAVPDPAPAPAPAPAPSIVAGEGDVFDSEEECISWYGFCYWSATYGKWVGA